MKKLKKYIIPAIVLLIFSGIMTSGEFLKRPFSKADDVYSCIEALKKDAVKEDWKQAKVHLEQLKIAWNIVEKRVQFSVERDEMNMIDTNIARIEGALSVHDKPSSIIELNEIANHWDELEK